MPESPVPSSSNSLPRGWTSWVIYSQNAELTLETWAPKSMQSPFAHPQLQGPHWIIQPGGQWDLHLRMEQLGHFFSWACPSDCLHAGWPLSGVGVRMCGDYCWLGWLSPAGGLATFPQFPPGWFKVNAGVGHSLAMWPQPCHLKHWREFGSHLLAVPSLLVLVPCLPCPLFPVPLPLPHSQWVRCRLGHSVQSHIYHYGNLGDLGYYHHCFPSHNLSPRGCLGQQRDCCPVQPWSGQQLPWLSAILILPSLSPDQLLLWP